MVPQLLRAGVRGLDLGDDLVVWEDEDGLLGMVVRDGAMAAVQDGDLLVSRGVRVEHARDMGGRRCAVRGIVVGWFILLCLVLVLVLFLRAAVEHTGRFDAGDVCGQGTLGVCDLSDPV